MEMGLSTSPVARSLQGSRTGGISFISTIMMTAAMAPVTTKVKMVLPMILPARLRLFIVAMDPEIEENTMGTTMQNIMFRNSVPRGLRTVAPCLDDFIALLDLWEEPATREPMIMEPSIDGQEDIIPFDRRSLHANHSLLKIDLDLRP